MTRVARRRTEFSTSAFSSTSSRLPAEHEHGASFVASVDELLARSDFLSLHAPATSETHHFLNAERIGRLPAGASAAQGWYRLAKVT